MIYQISSLEFSHFPVMLNEVLKISSPSRGGNFVDCTFGAGGYSKEILKFSKTKVQASIQGDELRISGKKRDDLQSTIQLVKNMSVKFPLQYVNFRD